MAIQAFAALIFVLSLIGLGAYIFSRSRTKFYQRFPGGIKVKDVKSLDGKNKVVSITYDNMSYVLLIGQNSVAVLDKKPENISCLDAEVRDA